MPKAYWAPFCTFTPFPLQNMLFLLPELLLIACNLVLLENSFLPRKNLTIFFIFCVIFYTSPLVPISCPIWSQRLKNKPATWVSYLLPLALVWNYSWGHMNKHLLTLDRELTTCQSKGDTKSNWWTSVFYWGSSRMWVKWFLTGTETLRRQLHYPKSTPARVTAQES